MTSQITPYSVKNYMIHGAYQNPNSNTAVSEYIAISKFIKSFNNEQEIIAKKLEEVYGEKGEKVLINFEEAILAGSNISLKLIMRCRDLGIFEGIIQYHQGCLERNRR